MTKGERREQLQRKRRLHREDGRSVKLLQEIIVKRAEGQQDKPRVKIEVAPMTPAFKRAVRRAERRLDPERDY